MINADSLAPLVLIVDDHHPAADMIGRLFTSHSYRVLCLYNGTEALEKARNLQPALILLDVMMPDMNGFEVLKQIRADPRTAHIPAIMVTAKDDPSDVEYGLGLGADDYLSKPIEPRELLARSRSKMESYQLRQVLQRRTRDLEALLRVSEALTTHLEISDLEMLILHLLLDLFPCQGAWILCLSEGHPPSAFICYRHEAPQPFEIDEARIQRILEKQEGPYQWSEENGQALLPSSSGMAAPLVYSGRWLGAVGLLAVQVYDEDAMRLFSGLAQQAALALRNAELYGLEVRYAETLEATVEERTQALKSAQQLLIRSEKLASIGRLAAGIAHEINNPLLPIILNLELMVEDLQDGTQIEVQAVQETLNSAQRISRTVERLLQFTRRRQGDTPDMQVLHIGSVIENVMALTQRFFQQDNIGVNFKIAPAATPYVYGNKDQLEQVFLNVMLNAKAAMSPGGMLTITITQDESMVSIAFQDTGTGIPADTLEKIFEPFYTTKDNGSGLGLFISHEIIHNHNGRIDVQSEVGKGTTVTLCLPVMTGMEEAESETESETE